MKSSPIGFLALGVAVFGLWQLRVRQAPIEVSPALEQALVAERESGLGRPLTADERTAATDAWVEEEVLFREALARRLEQSDPIVRRRLVQAMRFVLEEEGAEPTRVELEAFVAANADRFTVPATVSFEHVFSAGAFPMGPRFELQRQEELNATFGEGFATRVFGLAVGEWADVDSAFGRHRVRVSARTAARLPPLEQIAGSVRAELRDERRDRAAAQQVAALRSAYDVQLPTR